MNFDLTLIKDVTEMLGKSLNSNDIDTIGSYFIKDYSCHEAGGVAKDKSISPLKAANILMQKLEEDGKLKELFAFIIELDGTSINGKTARLEGLENILYRLSRTGIHFDFVKRKFVSIDENKGALLNWGSMRDGKEYSMIIASVDICGNSKLVEKYSSKKMEKVYYRLWEHLTAKIHAFEGRIWSWAGDGGLVAFRENEGKANAVACCFEIIFSMPIFNALPGKPIEDNIKLRIGMDSGDVTFFNDTGRIVSNVINYAAHLEKKSTKPNGLSVSEEIFNGIPDTFKKFFRRKKNFENRTAYSVAFNHKDSLS